MDVLQSTGQSSPQMMVPEAINHQHDALLDSKMFYLSLCLLFSRLYVPYRYSRPVTSFEPENGDWFDVSGTNQVRQN